MSFSNVQHLNATQIRSHDSRAEGGVIEVLAQVESSYTDNTREKRIDTSLRNSFEIFSAELLY